MTLKEAKKILNKEGFHLVLASKVINQTGAIREFEKPEVCEAIKVANANKWTVGLSPIEWDERKARLEEEYEKNTKAPGPGEEQPKEDNPALKEAASQFNDSLLDEQAKKIEELTKEKVNLEDQITILDACKKHNDSFYQSKIKSFGKKIARLKKIIHKKNMKIEEFRKESSRHLRGKIKVFYENRDLEGKLKDKDAVLSDVAEELRLSKIREENLTEVCQKYMNENEKLKKELADKVVDKIDAQALKSAESALAEKDEVIADLGKELAATKNELEAFKESYKRRIKEDSEHFEHIQKICNSGLQKWLIESEYLEKDKPFRSPQLPELSEEELMKLQEKVIVSYDKAEEGGDRSATIVECGKDIVDLFKETKRLWQD